MVAALLTTSARGWIFTPMYFSIETKTEPYSFGRSRATPEACSSCIVVRIGDCLQDQFARRYGKDILWVGLSGPRADVCLSSRLRVECSNLADLLGLLKVSSMV